MGESRLATSRNHDAPMHIKPQPLMTASEYVQHHLTNGLPDHHTAKHTIRICTLLNSPSFVVSREACQGLLLEGLDGYRRCHNSPLAQIA